MSRARLSTGPVTASLGQQGDGAPLLQSFALALADSSGTQTWRFDIEAGGPAFHARLGTVISSPPSIGGPSERVVLVASVPGATAWRVVARPFSDGAAPNRAASWIQATASRDMGGCCGLRALNGATVFSEGQYSHDAGIGAGVSAVPSGARVLRWSATAVGADGTVAITGLPVITIRAGNAFTGEPDGLRGPTDFTFAGGVDTWFVSWRE